MEAGFRGQCGVGVVGQDGQEARVGGGRPHQGVQSSGVVAKQQVGLLDQQQGQNRVGEELSRILGPQPQQQRRRGVGVGHDSLPGGRVP